jgi:serine protease inhibitor
MLEARSDHARPAVSRRAALQAGLGLLALSGLPTLAGCGSSGHHPAATGTGAPRALTVDVARADIPLSQVDVAPVVAGMTRFGADLYRVAATTTANWTISPMSIDVAFGMLRAGARGGTAKQIDHVFGYPATTVPSGSPHAVLNALTARLTSDRPVPTSPASPSSPSSPSSSPSSSGPGPTQPPAPIVAIANALFVDRSYESQVQKAFLRVLAGQYGASPDLVTFSDPSAVATINAWVTAQTRGRITKLFDHLDPSTRLVLANAVYLKAAWALPFSPDRTMTGAFTTGAGHRVQAHLMRQMSGLGYAAGDGWQRVSLPYSGGDLVMRIVVPTRPARDIAALGHALALATYAGKPDPVRPVDLTVPRWSTATMLPLVPPLVKLGLPAAFGQHADLSGIAPGLFVSDAIHRANITVDEKGTEAAAVTGIAIAVSGIAGSVATVRADRPFAWAIVHAPTGTPMFTGHVVDPTR